MKILLINKFLYPKGGDAIVTLSTGDLLKAHGHEVIYWGMKNSKNPSYPHEDLFIDEMDLNSSSGIKQQLKIAGKLLYSLEAKIKIGKLIKRVGKPDIVHLHNFAHQISPSILHVFKKYKIPVVMTMHDYKLVCASYTLLAHGQVCEKCAKGMHVNCLLQGCVKDSKTKSLLNTIEMYLHHKILYIYNLIDIFISPSQFLKDKVNDMGLKNPIEVLPNFIDTTNFIPQYETHEKTICYVGRLSKEKGLLTLIEAMKESPDIKLKIIGDGPLKESLKSKVESQKLNNINFLGYLSGDALKQEIQNSMFIILPSECYENNPRSVIEVFALGKPVIGARIGGIPELVKENETGLTFISRNTKDLNNKIRELISKPNKIIEMGKNARILVEKEFNAKKHYEKLIKIYERAIDNHK